MMLISLYLHEYKELVVQFFSVRARLLLFWKRYMKIIFKNIWFRDSGNTNCEIKHMKPEQRKTSTVLSPINTVDCASAVDRRHLQNVRIWNPFWETRQPEMSCRSNPVPFRFSRTRVTGVLPIVSSKGCFWFCVFGVTNRWQVESPYGLKCSSRGNNFFAPERNVKTKINVQKVHGTAGRRQCKLLYNPSTIK